MSNSKLAKTSSDAEIDAAMAAVGATESSPKPQSLSKVETSAGLTMPNPEINIQAEQRAAAQGSHEYAQGRTAARHIATIQGYAFKEGFAAELNETMPAIAQDVAEYVEGGERAVSNFFSDFTAQITGH